MRNVMNRLMAGVAYAAPELNGMGSFGGADQQQQGNGQQLAGSDSQQGPLIGFEDEPDEDADMSELLEAFKLDNDDDGDPDDTNLGDTTLAEVPAERVTAMQTEIDNAIKGMRGGAIPDDFDVNDRTALQGLMDRTVQAAVRQSLNVVFKPVQLAMSHMAGQMNQQIDNKISTSRETLRAQDVIETMVPEINDPKYRGLVTTMDSTLRDKGKKPQERAKAIRKMLNQMGIQGNSSATSNRKSTGRETSEPSISKREGKAALDSIFGSFAPAGKR